MGEPYDEELDFAIAKSLEECELEDQPAPPPVVSKPALYDTGENEDVQMALALSLSVQLPPAQPAQCSICWEDYKVEDPVRILPCIHRFHTHCISEWLEQETTCPECRTDINHTGPVADVDNPPEDLWIPRNNLPIPLPIPQDLFEDIDINENPERIPSPRIERKKKCTIM